MRRDYFDLTVHGVGDDADESVTPSVRIDFHGPDGLLRDRLSGSDDDLLTAAEVDVAFRLREPLSETDAEGVVGVTNRYTGDFVLELNETADDVLPFIHAARESADDDDDASYRIEIDVDGERLVAYDKDTFLVYDHEGNLLRSESLIPSGVEL